MREPGNAVLADLAPEGLMPDGPGRQRQKSADARVAILGAAIRCLERHGYARTTTQLIAKTAAISRGAMLYHYATKQDLMASVLDYAVYKRAERFLAAVANVTDEQRVRQMAGVELYWQSIQTPEFLAYLELQVASRTDAQLRPVFIRKSRRLDRLWRDTISQAFPEWASARERHELAIDYVNASMEGLMLNKEIWNDEKRRKTYRRFVALTTRMLWEGKIDLSDLPQMIGPLRPELRSNPRPPQGRMNGRSAMPGKRKAGA